MAWPFAGDVRAYMRLAARWLQQGWTALQILTHAGQSRHGYVMQDLQEAIPEAERSLYFANFLRTHSAQQTFGRSWFAAARGAWYAGYGRAPSTAERQWSYTRPQGQLGLMYEVQGRTVTRNMPVRYTITVNANWSDTPQAVTQEVFDYVTGALPFVPMLGTDYLDPATVQINLLGGALIARQRPTLTMP